MPKIKQIKNPKKRHAEMEICIDGVEIGEMKFAICEDRVKDCGFGRRKADIYRWGGGRKGKQETLIWRRWAFPPRSSWAARL